MSRDSKDFPAAFPSLGNAPGIACKSASLSATGGLADRHKLRGRQETLAGLPTKDEHKQSHRQAAGSASEPDAGAGQAIGSAEGRTA
ncbi:hypothetical protein [Treponema endosymbiont of Eucomonympha sp.]|uniref:hypothetical protein n=1 Tax=Treponema endosymbiont of Eucomonympha sp. TaxID=1580831 RepID=UPI0007833D36|nr:hypothetical protein [Treponema endosymbiont of Eucomonympha sp.]